VARAAVAGRIATLLVEVDRFEAGHMDRATCAIRPADEALSDDGRRRPEFASVAEDLFGAVAETVLEKGGAVVALMRNAMPTESGVAAVDRS